MKSLVVISFFFLPVTLSAEEGFIKNLIADFHSYRVEDKAYLEKANMLPDADEYQSHFVCGKKIDKAPELKTVSEKKDFYEEHLSFSTKCKVEVLKRIKASGCKINEMNEVPSRNQPEENYGHYRTYIFNSPNCLVQLKSSESCPSGTEARNLSLTHKLCIKPQPTSGFQKATFKTN